MSNFKSVGRREVQYVRTHARTRARDGSREDQAFAPISFSRPCVCLLLLERSLYTPIACVVLPRTAELNKLKRMKREDEKQKARIAELEAELSRQAEQ